MVRVAKFHKVSEEQFKKDFLDEFGFDGDKAYEIVKLPERATIGSAGYDFVSPIQFTLKPGKSIKIPTGIRCEMNSNYALFLLPRSGLGFKYHAMLANTLGLIDCDYYYSSNEGHIMVKIVNNGDKEFHVDAGERFCQGTLVPFGVTDDDNTYKDRNGGFGSTGK